MTVPSQPLCSKRPARTRTWDRASRRLVAMGCLAFAATQTLRAETPPPGATAALAEALKRAQAQGFAGEVLIADATQIWFDGAVGLARRQPDQSHRLGAVWRWGSVSKQITTTLAMRFVDEGQLSLDDTVKQRLPDFPSRIAGQLTVRQLMQHRTGLPQPDASPPTADGVPAFYRRSGPQLAAQGLAFCAGPPAGTPGERFEYNNCDTLVLGALLERVGGQPLTTLLRERFGMNTAPWGEGQELSTAVAYTAQGQPAPKVVLATFGAAGALQGTAADLLAFDRDLLGGRLVSTSGRDVLWAGEPRWGYAALGVWAYPAKPAGCTEPFTIIERRGDVGGIQARNLLVPSRQLSLIAFTNTADFDFGEVWQSQGFTHDLLAAALCSADPKS